MSEPEYLYRYQRLPDKNNPNEKDWLENLFVHNKLWFSSPKDFNDPFDFQLFGGILGSMKDSMEQRGFISKIIFHLLFIPGKSIVNNILDKNPQINSIPIIQKIQNDMNDSTNPKEQPDLLENEFMHFIEQYKLTIPKIIGVLCLSEVCDNILMWSHYANSHKGYCLILDSNFITNQQSNVLYKINYSSNPPSIFQILFAYNTNKSQEVIAQKIIKLIFSRKSKDWKYEKEWRIITQGCQYNVEWVENTNRYIPFPPEMLTGVIFGCEMKPDDRKEIENLVKSNPKLVNHVRLYKSKKKPNEFGLDIVPID